MTGHCCRRFNPGAEICREAASQAANQLYYDNRYPRLDRCDKPCTELDIKSTLMSKDSKPGTIEFFFPKKVIVSQEVLAYSFLSLIAELGGYLGLTLGVSLLQLEPAMYALFSVCRSQITGKNTK